MRAPLSGRSRNFGFCRFANQQERDRALVEMNGHVICDRPVRVSLATAKKIQPEGLALDAPPAGGGGFYLHAVRDGKGRGRGGGSLAVTGAGTGWLGSSLGAPQWRRQVVRVDHEPNGRREGQGGVILELSLL